MAMIENGAAADVADPKPVQAADLMNCPATAVGTRVQLAQAVCALRRSAFTTIAVVDTHGYLVNLITEESVAKAHLAHCWAQFVGTRRSDLGVTSPDFLLPPHSVELDAPPSEIIEIMLGCGLHSLPVVHAHRPIGIINWHDVPTLTRHTPTIELPYQDTAILQNRRIPG